MLKQIISVEKSTGGSISLYAANFLAWYGVAWRGLFWLGVVWFGKAFNLCGKGRKAMSESTVRRKLKEQLLQIRKVRGEDNLYRLIHMDIGAYNYHYYTFQELVAIAKSYDED